MTERLLDDIHTRLARRRYFQLRDAGQDNGRPEIQAFDETLADALTIYRALPWWRRMFGGTSPLDSED